MFETNSPSWLTKAKLLGFIGSKEFTNHRYRFLTTKKIKDVSGDTIKKNTSESRIIVFPFKKRMGRFNPESEIAAYIEEDEYFTCGMAKPGSNRVFLLKGKNNEYSIFGRWENDTFLSKCTSMADIEENVEIKQEKAEQQGSECCLSFKYKNYDVYIMPVLFKNQGAYTPFIAVLQEENNGDYLVCATRDTLQYKNIRLACYWDDGILKCFELPEG